MGGVSSNRNSSLCYDFQMRSCLRCRASFDPSTSSFYSYCSSPCNRLAYSDRHGKCVVKECDRRAEARRMCGKHYGHVRRCGQVNPARKSVPQRELAWSTNKAGYVTMPARGGGNIKQHRVVMENILFDLRGYYEPLPAGQTVHHRNGIRDDNSPGNLQIRRGHHGPGAAFRCRTCGSQDVEAVEL